MAGTRDALYLPGQRLPWEQVEAADWDHDTGRIRVSEVGRWGEQRVEHALTLDETAATGAHRLLQLVRERVTASVLLVRHVPITGRRGVRVVARRAPSGSSPVQLVLRVRRRASTPMTRSSGPPPRRPAAARADVGVD